MRNFTEMLNDLRNCGLILIAVGVVCGIFGAHTWYVTVCFGVVLLAAWLMYREK